MNILCKVQTATKISSVESQFTVLRAVFNSAFIFMAFDDLNFDASNFDDLKAAVVASKVFLNT